MSMSLGFSSVSFSDLIDLADSCTSKSPCSIEHIGAPISKVSPSCASIFNLPEDSAVKSKVALSESISAMTSSSSTISPSFFNQEDIVTSFIDSPTAGTIILIISFFILNQLNIFFINSSCSFKCTLRNPVDGDELLFLEISSIFFKLNEDI